MRNYLLLVFFICFFTTAFAQSHRQWLSLNEGWDFYWAYDMRPNIPKEKVNLPHTWNAQEALEEKMRYTRDAAFYEKKIQLPATTQQQRYFLYFEGANSFAQVFVNKKLAGEHKGGYTAFCLEITALVQAGKENQLQVWVSNAMRPDILPLTGDFNIYGGLHRSVHLLITGDNCISPLDYASPGIYLTPKLVTKQAATVDIATRLSVKKTGVPLTVRSILYDASKKTIGMVESAVKNGDTSVNAVLNIQNPRLWNSRQDPYLYKIVTQLREQGKVVDEVEQPLGLRYYRVSADSGLFLNGRYLDLYGFGLHEDVAGKGSAMSRGDFKKDIDLVLETGANALRFTHYPHSGEMYRLADSSGIILWSEIPLVGPGGYTGTGYMASASLQHQARQLMIEMIRQNYNHPSVFFWGLFNELKLDYDNPIPFLEELNALAKNEDPSRLTTCASFLDNDQFNHVSDLIAWNKYYGWYGGKFSDIGPWADKLHHQFPRKPIAISEYGAGAGITQHADSLLAPVPTGEFHPEEWQTAFHEAHWKEMAKRPYLWGKYIWVLADFGSSIRTEGERDGINDKGLVTYDRITKKDAFFYYKANWNSSPMIHITQKRFEQRANSLTDIKVFSNLPELVLMINGKYVATVKPDAFKTAVFSRVELQSGNNKIKVTGSGSYKNFKDECSWLVEGHGFIIRPLTQNSL